MIQNPFITTGDMPEAYFCDRVEETARLTELITSGANVCLVSPRRMGKSKLIKHLFLQPDFGDCYTIYVELFHTGSIREFIQAFGAAVLAVLQSRGEKTFQKIAGTLRSVTPKLSVDPLTGMPSLSIELGQIQSPEHTLEEIFSLLEYADKSCVVAFDEFQQVANYAGCNAEALLRGHIQHLSNSHFIFCGSERHLIADMFLSRNRPFYASTEPFALKAIPFDRYLEFVQRMMADRGRAVEREAVEKTYQVANGNTAFMQRVFHFAFNTMNSGDCCTVETVTRSIVSLVDSAGELFQPLMAQIPESQKMLLYAIASEGEAQSIMGGEFIRRHNLKSSSSVQVAAKKLKELDFITQEGNTYRISDPLFQLYLRELNSVTLSK